MRNTKHQHRPADVARAASLFFALRGLMRTRLAQGRRLDPSVWLRIETLIYIRDHGGPSMKAIAKYLSITAPSATSLIAALARAGLVKRRGDRVDRRAARIRLTPRGARLLKGAQARGRRILADVFSPLSKREFAAFTRALERMLS